MENNFKVIKASIKQCGVIFDVTSIPDTAKFRNHYAYCNEGFEQLRKMILSYEANVLVVSRWTYQMFPAPGVVEELNFDNGVGGKEVDLAYRENRAVFEDGTSSIAWVNKRDALIKLLEGLTSASKHLFVNYPIPEMGWNIFNENVHSIRIAGKLVGELMYPSSTYYNRNAEVIGVLENFASDNPTIDLVRSDLAFCETIRKDFCVGQLDDVIYYIDDDHLSDVGARLFLNQIPLNRLFGIND